MNRFKFSLYVLFAVMSFVYMGCRKESRGTDLNLSSSVDIQQFTVGTTQGKIDSAKGAISINLPFGADFTKVVPNIALAAGATVNPVSGASVNLTNPLQYRVINGNIYKDYTVTAKEIPAILLFKAQGDTGVIDESARAIKVVVPPGSDMTQIKVEVQLAAGASITPASGTTIDFTNPVVFTVKTATASVNYMVTAIDVNADKPIAFLGNYPTGDAITNADEKAA